MSDLDTRLTTEKRIDAQDQLNRLCCSHTRGLQLLAGRLKYGIWMKVACSEAVLHKVKF